MMRSLYSGVSGLRNHQTRMDVIGNNIANVNTAGYKKSRVVFKDTLYQTVRGASSPTASQGGTNPMGIGLGMTVASIDQIHTGAPPTTTNKLTDMAVNGNGYFIVGNAGIAGETYYTRAGAFDLDVEGNLVSLTNGYHVKGWNAVKTTTATGTTINFTPNGEPTADINIKQFKDIDKKETRNMVVSGNLDASMGFDPNRDEWQTLSFGTIPFGGAGNFKLTIDGKTTAAITVGTNGTTTATAIQTALVALPNVGSDSSGNPNVAVSWDAVRQRYDIKFQNALKQTNMPVITFTAPTATYNGGGIAAGGAGAAQTLAFATAPNQGGIAGGGFTLEIGGETTGYILVGATPDVTATNIQNALNAITLPSPATRATVAWNAGTSVYDITFDANPGVAIVTTNSLASNTAFTGGTAAVAALIEGQPPLSPMPINEVQTLDLTTSVTAGGTFKLTYAGPPSGTTANIPFDATAAQIEAALIAPTANPTLAGNIKVTTINAPTATAKGGKFTIEFINGKAGTNINQMVVTNVTTCSGKISTATQGQPAGNPLPANIKAFSKDVYDSTGESYPVNFRFFKYEIQPGDVPGAGGTTPAQPVTKWACDISVNPLFEGQAGYNANADLRAVDLSGIIPAPAPGTEKITRVYNIDFDQNGNIKLPIGTAPLSINFQNPATGAANAGIKIDLQKLSQAAGASSAWVESQDGYAKGSLTSYSIGIDGIITGSYNNGQKQSLAQVGMANFENPGGLQQTGGTIFQQTVNSGDAKKGKPGENGTGTVIPGSLEMSNVDLSEEFTDMIVTQRGFQANSRIITTSDEMLQELVNLKR